MPVEFSDSVDVAIRISTYFSASVTVGGCVGIGDLTPRGTIRTRAIVGGRLTIRTNPPPLTRVRVGIASG